jgi:hypothetical protein
VIKFPYKTDLDITEEQRDFAVSVAAELTRIRGSKHKVSTRTAWRLFNDCCRANPTFFWHYVSTNTNFSTDKEASA